MGTVSTSLHDRAESIFADLGYEVERAGSELRARRKWRTVHVTPMIEPDEPPESGEYRCFVTFEERIDDLERELTACDPEYEWAIIGVAEDERYEVARRSLAP